MSTSTETPSVTSTATVLVEPTVTSTPILEAIH
jgi:hypothetical protein